MRSETRNWLCLLGYYAELAVLVSSINFIIRFIPIPLPSSDARQHQHARNPIKTRPSYLTFAIGPTTSMLLGRLEIKFLCLRIRCVRANKQSKQDRTLKSAKANIKLLRSLLRKFSFLLWTYSHICLAKRFVNCLLGKLLPLCIVLRRNLFRWESDLL